MGREVEQLFAAVAILGLVLLAAHFLDGLEYVESSSSSPSGELVPQFVIE